MLLFDFFNYPFLFIKSCCKQANFRKSNPSPWKTWPCHRQVVLPCKLERCQSPSPGGRQSLLKNWISVHFGGAWNMPPGDVQIDLLKCPSDTPHGSTAIHHFWRPSRPADFLKKSPHKTFLGDEFAHLKKKCSTRAIFHHFSGVRQSQAKLRKRRNCWDCGWGCHKTLLQRGASCRSDQGLIKQFWLKTGSHNLLPRSSKLAPLHKSPLEQGINRGKN